MSRETIVSESAEQTIEIGRGLAGRLRAPELVLLKGDLGAGKTTLAKGMISGLGVAQEEDVTSPTFTLVHVFQAGDAASPREAAPLKVYHVDLYRIEGQHELETLALEDVLGSSEPGIVIVEWSERLTIGSDWPVLRIEMKHGGGDRREIEVMAPEEKPEESAS